MNDPDLIPRVRTALAGYAVTEQRMFGALCFLVDGNMLAGAFDRGLMVRVGKDEHDRAVARPHAEPMRQGARIMAGYVVVAPEGLARDGDLAAWLDLALAHVATLPARPPGTAGRRGRKRMPPPATGAVSQPGQEE